MNNALILACKCLHVERVNRFLKKNVNLNFKDELGNTALMYVREAFCKDEDACTRRNEIEELVDVIRAMRSNVAISVSYKPYKL